MSTLKWITEKQLEHVTKKQKRQISLKEKLENFIVTGRK